MTPLYIKKKKKKQKNKRQLLRLPYCSKENQNRELKRIIIRDNKPYKIIDNLSDCPEKVGDYLVSNIQDEKLVSSEEKKHEISDTVSEVSSIYTGIKSSQTNIENLMECLNFEDQDWDWGYWTRIIWGLRNTSDANDLDLRDLAHKVSKGSKYDEATTDRIYDGKNKNPPTKPITIATLIKEAKKTNPALYMMWRENLQMPDTNVARSSLHDTSSECKLMKSAFTDGDVADYVVGLWGDDIRVEGDDVYKRQTHYWLKSDNSVLAHLLDTEVYTKVRKVADEVYDKAENFKKYVEIMKNINNLRNVRPRNNYINAILTRIRTHKNLVSSI